MGDGGARTVRILDAKDEGPCPCCGKAMRMYQSAWKDSDGAIICSLPCWQKKEAERKAKGYVSERQRNVLMKRPAKPAPHQAPPKKTP